MLFIAACTGNAAPETTNTVAPTTTTTTATTTTEAPTTTTIAASPTTTSFFDQLSEADLVFWAGLVTSGQFDDLSGYAPGISGQADQAFLGLISISKQMVEVADSLAALSSDCGIVEVVRTNAEDATGYDDSDKTMAHLQAAIEAYSPEGAFSAVSENCD